MADNSPGVIPEAKKYERAVLGCMMLDNSAIEIAIEMLESSCFYSPSNEVMYQAICELYEQNSEVDMLTIEAVLTTNGKLDAVGGTAFIGGIENEVSSGASIREYCNILVEQDERRKLLVLGKGLINMVSDKSIVSDKIIEGVQENLNKIGIKKAVDYHHIKDILPEAYQAIVDMSNNEKTVGISCGISSVDRALGGFTNGGLFVLAGRTGTGKTAFALDVSVNIAKQDIPVLCFSMEMKCVEVAHRLISKESPAELFGIQYKKFADGKEEGLFFEGITHGCGRLSKFPIIIDETPAISISKMQIKIEKAIREYGIKMVVVDYLQLMTGVSGDRRLEIESITRSLKQFAMQYNIPIVALSQLNRSIDHRGEEYRPVLADLRESGSIEQDANVVMFIHNSTPTQKLEYDLNTENNSENIRELIIRKNRNGECSTVLLYWKAEYASFYGLYNH